MVGNDEKGIAEAATHEVGHTVGLYHDGDSTQEYYPGHGTGDDRMGADHGRGLLLRTSSNGAKGSITARVIMKTT